MGNILSPFRSVLQRIMGEPSTEESNVLNFQDKHPQGSKVYVYKQYLSVSYVGHRVVWLPLTIHRGPETESVRIVMDGSYSSTDTEGNYLYDPEDNPDGFDAVHTLAVVEKVRLMYRRAMGLKYWERLRWQWGTSPPITVYPHAGEDINAFYSRQDKALRFFYFEGKDNGENIYTCRSWDTVAHEAGHAILDGLQPFWLEANSEADRVSYTFIESNAIHESFGDLTAIFSVLDQLDMCELLVAHTKGNLQDRTNVLAVLCEEFSEVEGVSIYGIRNGAENFKVSDVFNESHDLSRVFTGAVYDVLVRIFMLRLDVSERSPAQTLYNVGKDLLACYLNAILNAPRTRAAFDDIALLMINYKPLAQFRTIMHDEFSRREIFDKSKKPKPLSDSVGVKTSHCCVVAV